MAYMNKSIKEATPQELLLALIKAEGLADGPVRTVYVEPVLECLVGIGNDNTAHIRLCQDDLDALEALVIHD